MVPYKVQVQIGSKVEVEIEVRFHFIRLANEKLHDYGNFANKKH